MRGFIKLAGSSAALLLLASGVANAVPIADDVTCGNSALGTRTVTVTGGLDGGYCDAINGNPEGGSPSNYLSFNTSGLPTGWFGTVSWDDAVALKNAEWGSTEWPQSGNSGTYSFDSAYLSFDRLFIAFHFGGGGECDPSGPTCTVDPDSFLVELDRNFSSGTWTTNFTKWGLSNMYLLAYCEPGHDCNPPEKDVPEPGTLGLLGLGLAGLGFGFRRRRKI